MKKTLSFLLGLGLSLGLGINAYSQSSQSEIPDTIRKRAVECLKRVAYCPGDPIIKKIEEKTRYMEVEKDSARVSLYNITNNCFYFIPNHLVHIKTKLKNGKFSEKGIIDEIVSKDNTGKPIPLEADWWKKLLY